NHAFRDHYLDVELDLSHVLFIATANVADTIPGPLVDRMEVIRFDGYTVEEKLAIARGFLWPRQVERNGLRPDEVSIDDAVVRTVITEYTREAGVRQLERELGRLLRKTATRVAAGAATAPVAIDPAVAHEALGRPRFFQESAERTALPGVATGLAVTPTGGGVKQKVLAAHAAGLTDVILPERNRGDLDEVPAEVQQAMRFHLVSSVDEVLALALEKGEKALAA